MATDITQPRSHDTSRIAWAKLMARGGEEFPLACPNCGGDIRLRPTHHNHVWSHDFVMDRTADGRSFRMLTIVDE